MPQFFEFKGGELLERNTHTIKGFAEYSFSNVWVNTNKFTSITKLGDKYKLFIGERDFYIKEETFQRLKAEVLDGK